MKSFLIFFVHSILILHGPYRSFAQRSDRSDPKTVSVQTSLQSYRKDVRSDNDYLLQPLLSRTPGLKADLRYASTRNFVGKRMYPAGTSETFLRKPAADAILRIQSELKNMGMGLKIFDAYRPYTVTCRFWELIKDERYVANPAKGSGHNRGLAIDLTIIRLADGKELNMGTDFDHFSDTAHHSFSGLPVEVLENRRLLKSLMEKHGFNALETEWWHYAWTNDKNYPVMDLSFRQLLDKTK